MYETFRGTVIENISDKFYKVIVDTNECTSCTLKSHCSFYKGPSRIIAKSNVSNLETGDKVIVRIKTNTRITASTIFYFVPAVLLMLSIVSGVILKLHDWQMFLLFLFLLAIYLGIVKTRKFKDYPEVISLISETSRD